MAEENKTTQEITEQDGVQPVGGGAKSTPADGGKSPASQATLASQTTLVPQEDEKKFSQKELDDIVKQRLDRAAKGQPSKEELAAFRKWQDEQKTDEQRHADEIKKALDDKAAAELRVEELEAKYTAMTKGVKPEAVEDVFALAKGRVSETVTLGKAIDEVLKKYPQFGAGEASKPRITTGVPSIGGTNTMSGVEKRFYERNPELLKKT